MSEAADRSARVEALYALSPMQEGMLFHSLLSPGSGIYLMQNRYRLQGELAAQHFELAWQDVVARHPVLRTSFVWKSQSHPLQVVQREVELPFESLDWRELGAEQQQARLEVELRAELERGFDLARAPLMRLRLIRLGERSYEFVHSFHHILLDEWCTSLVMMDFLACYEARLAGRTAGLAPARPYRDYIAWLERQDRACAERFWRSYLAGASRATALGLDSLGAAQARSEGEGVDEVSLRLDAHSTELLCAWAQRGRLTLNTVLQGAWALLLSRYSSEPEVIFGVTVAGRPPELPGVESIVGLFINTLPLRVRVPPDAVLLPWLGELLEQNLRLRQYEHTPLVDVQRWSELPRGEALFESLFVFENAPLDPVLRRGGMRFAVSETRDRVHTNYPLTLVAWPDRELGLKLSYERARIGRATALRILEQLRTLLQAMAQRPEARLAELALLTADERRRALCEWSGTARGGARSGESLPERLAALAQRDADAIAARCGARSLRYGELERAANRIAHGLRARGVGPESLVALLDERDLELLIGIIGVLKAGAAILPLDPAHPDGRLAQILAQSRPCALLTRERSRERAAPWCAGREANGPLLLSVEALLTEPQPESAPALRTGGEHELAYAIYTSGSTGAPKGVMVERRGMLNHILHKIWSLALTPADAVAQTAAPGFDIAVWQFVGALLFGGRVEILPDEIARDPERLLEAIAERGVSVLEVVPAVLAGLIAAARARESLPRLEALRWVLPTGEALPPALAREWLALYPGIPLVNAYGPAECSDDVALHVLREAPAQAELAVPIGRPVDGLRLYVLDRFLEPAPLGVSGEICVGGIGVGRGYLGDPRQTAAAFLPDPHGAEPGARLYCTGDLGRYRADGAIEFAGRRDQQLKLRGLRIELGEIEAVLGAHPDVRECAVIARGERGGAPQLLAYAAGSGLHGGAPGELARWLEARLPRYMVPAAFVVLPQLPRLPSGKLDRQSLPEPVAAGGADAFAAPRGATQELLAQIWAQVLDVDRVGATDRFFELGGHSLLVTQVLSRIRRSFGVELSLRALFEAQTVAEQAERIDAALRRPAPLGPPLAPLPRGGSLPLSFGQERLWFLAQLEPESAAYHLALGLRLQGPLQRAALEQALCGLAQQHEALRTVFGVENGEPRQWIRASALVPLRTAELAPTGEGDEALRELAREEAARPFDLAQGPLLRALLVRRSAEEHALLLSVHHIAADGGSLEILVRDAARLYEAAVAGRAAELEPLPVQYADYAHWQRERLDGEELQAQLAYWKERLAGAPAQLELPCDHPRPALPSTRGRRHPVELPAEWAERLRALCRREGVTPFMAILAAMKVWLARCTGESDLCVGSPVARRAHVELEDVVGFFANTLVLRTDLGGDPPFAELLRRVRKTVLEAHAYADAPFERVVDAVAPVRDLGRTPLFQVMLALQQQRPASRAPVAGLRIEELEIDPGTAKFDLSLELTLDADGLAGALEYSADLFEPDTIARMVRRLCALLRAAVASPAARLSALPMLEPDEEKRLLEWSAGPQSALRPEWVHERIGRQAARTPHALALRCGEQRLSYAELERRSNRLAHWLRRHGAGPETRVAVCLERSLELPVALLAVLKAGAAYVPLDPGYPRERLRAVFADARPLLAVTQHALLEALPAAAAVLCVDRDAPLLAAEPDSAPLARVVDESLAYVIYTSGSTGTPKGVMVSHAGLAWFLAAMLERFGSRAQVGLAQTSVSFDIAALELFLPLCAGGALCLVDREQALDGEQLGAVLARSGATLVQATPTGWSVLLDAAQPPALRGRVALCGGEALSPELARRLVQSGAEVWNMYGPTETTVWSALAPVAAESEPISLGRPIAGTQLYVLDRALRPAPIGVPGELCIGGRGLARGYWGRPDLTAERFVPDPFGEPGQRLYRTGDRVRYRADGALEFLGRLDSQLKLRGFRIEPGEIEACLRRHPTLRDAVVLASGAPGGTRRLVAYVLGREAERPDSDALRAWVAQQLPPYMVPAAVVALERFPVLASGKLDRRALENAAPDASASRPSREPHTPAERALAEVWAQVLGAQRVGAEDDFFELGGDSIAVVQVVMRARERGLAFTPRQLFQWPTVAGLAAVAGELAAAGDAPGGGLALAASPPGASPPLAPLSDADLEPAALERLLEQLG